MHWDELKGKRVAILGAGREGQAAQRALEARSLPAIVLDEGTATNAPGVKYGPFDGDHLRRFDVIIKSPGISPYRASLQSAADAGVRFTSGSALWFAMARRCQVIAVSGTKGKSTVSALIAHLARCAGLDVAIGGNFGRPLLDLDPGGLDLVVAELSSYQTADFRGRPDVALLTNLYPEHLDWHGSVERYYSDKLKLFAEQPSRGLCREEELSRVRSVMEAAAPWNRGPWSIRDRQILHGDKPAAPLDWPLRGDHNADNLIAAISACTALGLDVTTGLEQLAGFQSLAHRQQIVHRCRANQGELVFVDDSIATTPYATLVALRAFADRPTAVIVGGMDRGLDWSDFAAWCAASPPAGLITRGANARRIEREFMRSGVAFVHQESLDDAVRAAVASLKGTGTILLSPGAPSYGEFTNYIERGERFATIARERWP